MSEIIKKYNLINVSSLELREIESRILYSFVSVNKPDCHSGVCDNICSDVCHQICTPVCDQFCSPVCGGICDYVCDSVCDYICDNVCDSICDAVNEICTGVSPCDIVYVCDFFR